MAHSISAISCPISQYFIAAEPRYYLDTTYRLPKPQICDTYFFMIKTLGRDRAKIDDSNAYKIMMFGPFIVEIWTL